MPSKSGSELAVGEDAWVRAGSVEIVDRCHSGYHSDLAGLAISSSMAFCGDNPSKSTWDAISAIGISTQRSAARIKAA